MLEQTAFEVCDTNFDGALSWLEVEDCEVNCYLEKHCV